MKKQKNQEPLAQPRQTNTKQSPISNMRNAHQQLAATKPTAGGGQNATSSALTPAPQKSASSNQEDEVTKAATLMFEHIEEQIGRADTKAQLILAADALLASSLIPLGKGIVNSLLSTTSPMLNRLADIGIIFMFFALLGSIFCAFRVINPHLYTTKRSTLMYFGQIAQMKEQDFITTFGNQSPLDLREATLAQVHVKARIAHSKYRNVRWSVTFLIVSLVFWAITQLLLSFL